MQYDTDFAVRIDRLQVRPGPHRRSALLKASSCHGLRQSARWVTVPVRQFLRTAHLICSARACQKPLAPMLDYCNVSVTIAVSSSAEKWLIARSTNSVEESQSGLIVKTPAARNIGSELQQQVRIDYGSPGERAGASSRRPIAIPVISTF